MIEIWPQKKKKKKTNTNKFKWSLYPLKVAYFKGEMKRKVNKYYFTWNDIYFIIKCFF